MSAQQAIALGVSTSAKTADDVIAVENLTFTYPKTVEPAVRGMEFAVRRGGGLRLPRSQRRW
jgi:ABC-type transport system involved in cytochrome bd biosynthesis fused ATPase/permease subunit